MNEHFDLRYWRIRPIDFRWKDEKNVAYEETTGWKRVPVSHISNQYDS